MPVIESALFLLNNPCKVIRSANTVARTDKHSNDYCCVKYLCKLDVCLPISSRIILHDLN